MEVPPHRAPYQTQLSTQVSSRTQIADCADYALSEAEAAALLRAKKRTRDESGVGHALASAAGAGGHAGRRTAGVAGSFRCAVAGLALGPFVTTNCTQKGEGESERESKRR